MAQAVERILGKDEVASSILASSSSQKETVLGNRLFLFFRRQEEREPCNEDLDDWEQLYVL